MRRLDCDFVVGKPPKTGFLASGSHVPNYMYHVRVLICLGSVDFSVPGLY